MTKGARKLLARLAQLAMTIPKQPMTEIKDDGETTKPAKAMTMPKQPTKIFSYLSLSTTPVKTLFSVEKGECHAWRHD